MAFKIQTLDPGLLKVSSFSNSALQARNEIEKIYTQKQQQSERFVWDPWTIEKQYNLLRCPMEALLSEENCNTLLDDLGRFAQEELGLMALSHPWISLYTEGHYQNWHTDPQHGPWAFVLSLTPNSFFENSKGGFTRILNCFSEKMQSRLFEEAQEVSDMFSDLEAGLNELIVFDPRRPHMVEKVQGAESLLEGRMVIHGWFTDPQPFLAGKLDSNTLQSLIDLSLEAADEIPSRLNANVSGYLLLRISNNTNGIKAEVKRSNLVDTDLKHYFTNEWWASLCSSLEENIQAQALRADSEFELSIPLVLQ